MAAVADLFSLLRHNQHKLFHMKKLVTSLFLLAGLAASSVNAQQTTPLGKPFIGKLPGKAKGTLPSTRFEGPRTIKGSMAPLAEDQYMLFVDLEGELTNWTLPRLISFTSGETDTLVMFMQRFTNPYPTDVVYLDSVFAFVQVNAIAEEAQTNNITVSAYYATQPNENGYIYPALSVATPTNKQRVNANNLELETISEVAVSFRTNTANTNRRKIDFNRTYTNNAGETVNVHPTDFFIGVSIPFYTDLEFDPENEINEQNQIGVIGDAQFYDGTYDPENMRGMASGLNYSVAWAGIGTAEESYYANFAIIAKVADNPTAQAGVVAESKNFSLEQNYPNPFNPSTRIEYTVDETLPVTVKIFNAMGVEVATLVNEIKPEGRYSVSFDALNLPSGNYIYTMTAGNETISKAMTLSK